MEASSSGFPPESYSTAFNLRNEIKQYLMSKGLSKLKNGVLKVGTSKIRKREAGTQLVLGSLVLAKLALHISAFCQSENTNKESWKPTCCAAKNKRCCNRKQDHCDLLKFLALNALNLSAPASDALLRSHDSSDKDGPTTWFQLSGHPDAFAPAGPGTLWKRCGPGGEEKEVYEALTQEPDLRGITPTYLRQVDYDSQSFIELQDLLHGFRDPNVMDVKLGTRTFLEDEVQNTAARHDLYCKMVQMDPNAPTKEEHEAKAVTKLRYMQLREEQSSTCSLGFRIEAMRFRGSKPVTDLKRVKLDKEVEDTLSLFLGGREDVRQRLLARLVEIRNVLDQSVYFKKHEVVGSSILLLYDDSRVGAWLIDFAKTRPAPDGIILNHRSPWEPGNHEEGFLTGLDNLIKVLQRVNIEKCETAVATRKPLALRS